MSVFSKPDIAVYALYLSGGISMKIHTDDIAAKCYDLSPDNFSWDTPKYHGWPHWEKARKALSDCTRASDNRVQSNRGSWSLTDHGLSWVKCHKNDLQELERSKHNGAKKIDATKAARTRTRIAASPLYRRYKDDGGLSEDLNRILFSDLVGCPTDAPAGDIMAGLNNLLGIIDNGRKNGIITFLLACRSIIEEEL